MLHPAVIPCYPYQMLDKHNTEDTPLPAMVMGDTPTGEHEGYCGFYEDGSMKYGSFNDETRE
ncbi:hypothetical protein Holit_02013 [Hollandina sp. SP2]